MRVAGLPAWLSRESGQVRKEAATAIDASAGVQARHSIPKSNVHFVGLTCCTAMYYLRSAFALTLDLGMESVFCIRNHD